MAKPQFTKIVANDAHVALNWTSKKKTASEAEEIHSHELTCEEKPRPAFDVAMQAFKPFLLKIIGAPKEWAEKTIVRGISLKKEESGARGIVISAIRYCPFGSAPIAINTPYLREQTDETKESGSNFFLDGMVDAIEELCDQADEYLKGNRAQGELFSDDKPPSKRKGKESEPELIGSIAARAGVPAGARA